VTARISKLELCAADLERAGAADRDWRAAVEINDLTEHAAAAVQVFREQLGQASLAAQALVLPPAAGDDG
jgi:hypothetical protein